MMSNSSQDDFVTVFETTRCDNCQSEEAIFLFSGHDRMYGLPGIFSLVQCPKCGWIRQNPRPAAEDITKYYPVNYKAYSKAIEDEKSCWIQWSRSYGISKRCRSIEKLKTSGRLLEVGCGTGIFLNEMQKRGWSVVGVEPNYQAGQYAVNRFSLEIFRHTVEEFAPVAKDFDVIVLWNVLEHLPTPAQDLKKLYHALRFGGLFVLCIPNLESLDRKLFGKSWSGWDLPRHLYLFPRGVLEKFFQEMGMEVIARQGSPGNYQMFLIGLEWYLCDHTTLSQRVIESIVIFLNLLPLRILASPIFWLLNATYLSSNLTYFVRKR